MIKILIFCLIALVLIVFLRQVRSEYALIAAVVAGCFSLLFAVSMLYGPVSQLLDLLGKYGTPTYLVTYLLKCLGICLLTKFSAELCADFGQSSLASKVELAGRSAVLVLSIPVIRSILSAGLELI